MEQLSRDVVRGVLAAIVAGLLFRFARGYPWPLATVMALSIGALVFVTGRNLQRIRIESKRLDHHDDDGRS